MLTNKNVIHLKPGDIIVWNDSPYKFHLVISCKPESNGIKVVLLKSNGKIQLWETDRNFMYQVIRCDS